MNIYPDCTIQTLAECKPTQLVRVVEYGGLAGHFGLVSDVVDQAELRAVVILDDGVPAYHIVKQPENFKVLAFGATPSLIVDPQGPFEAQAQSLYSSIGCISRHKDRWLMRVREYFAEFRPRQGSYDLETGMLGNRTDELSGVAFFGKWRITIPGPDADAPPAEIASFEWKEPQHQ